MASSRKKVLVRRFSAGVTAGYLPQTGFVRRGEIELLGLEGRVTPLALREIKMVSFVRDFNLGDQSNPERLLRKTFLARPRGDGLWLRLNFKDGDALEGLAPTDMTLFDSVEEDAGLQIEPPDTRGNTQRIYVPRVALTAVELVAVVHTQGRRKGTAAGVAPTQEELFRGDLPPNSRPN